MQFKTHEKKVLHNYLNNIIRKTTSKVKKMRKISTIMIRHNSVNHNVNLFYLQNETHKSPNNYS